MCLTTGHQSAGGEEPADGAVHAGPDPHPQVQGYRPVHPGPPRCLAHDREQNGEALDRIPYQALLGLGWTHHGGRSHGAESESRMMIRLSERHLTVCCVLGWGVHLNTE